MPKRLIKKLQKIITSPSAQTIACTEIPRGVHHFPEQDISSNVLKVLDTLVNAGFEAYLVGGSIRDGLLGFHPKDFDVATDAHPEQIKELFQQRCRLIGRRFRLAHVRCGREVIEVATFRAGHDNQPEESSQRSSQSDEGMLLRDNVYGTLEEDAVRRDFSANALYYRHTDGAILDFVGGYQDIQAKTLRLIGDPEQRYREDPVRMLRAVRFVAKLELSMDPATAAPIEQLAGMLDHIPPARLFEEVLKLFLSGHAQAVWQLMIDYHLVDALLPYSHPDRNQHPGAQAMIDLALRNTDIRLAAGKSVTPAFLFAVLLWGPFQTTFANLNANSDEPFSVVQGKAMNQVINLQIQHTSIPKRFGLPMREIWELQSRLSNRSPRRCEKLMEQSRFRAAYDLLLLREEAGECDPGLGEWWTRYQELAPGERHQLFKDVANTRPKKSRRYRGRRSSQPAKK